MKTNYFLTITLIFCTLQISAQRVWTLQECVDTALMNNRNIKQQRLNYKSKVISYNQAKSDRLPNLNASIGQNFNFGRSLSVDNTYQNSNSQNTSFSVSSGVNLYNGFRMKNAIEARQAELMAAGADVQKIEKDIILNVSAAFLQVLQNKELLRNADNQLQITRENMARRKELIEAGITAVITNYPDVAVRVRKESEN